MQSSLNFPPAAIVQHFEYGKSMHVAYRTAGPVNANVVANLSSNHGSVIALSTWSVPIL
jgi:hypothetical protein